MCTFLHHSSRYSIALNSIFTGYTLSPTFPNSLSSLQQMESMPSLVKNHYSQKNREAHLERALAFMTEANLDCPQNVCHPIICLRALYYGWLISLIWLMNQDEHQQQLKFPSETPGCSGLLWRLWRNLIPSDGEFHATRPSGVEPRSVASATCILVTGQRGCRV